MAVKSAAFVLPVLLLCTCQTSFASPESYPNEGGERVSRINDQFQHEIVRAALASLDSILAVVNVSTELNNIQKRLQEKNEKYERMTEKVEEYQLEIELCQSVAEKSWENCLDCVVACDQLSDQCSDDSIESLQRNMETKQMTRLFDLQRYNFKASDKEIETNLRFIDRVHKEVNKMTKFLVQLLAQFAPSVESDTPVKWHLMEKLNLTATEIVEIFGSLKFLTPYERMRVNIKDGQLDETRNSVNKLIKSFNGTSVDLIDGQDLAPYLDIPEKRNHRKTSIWDKVKDNVNKGWSFTKDVAGSVWGTTKDVSSTAYCSVKSVFFSSDCNNKRRRRSPEDQESSKDCSSEEAFSAMEESCQDSPTCSSCARFLDVSSPDNCNRRNVELALENHAKSMRKAIEAEGAFKKEKKSSDDRRGELLSYTYNVFVDNLWIVPFAMEIQEKKDFFELQDLMYDPVKFFMEGSKVRYEDVRVRMKGLATNKVKSSSAWIKLDPFDVHNETMTAELSASKFVSLFKELDYVQENVGLLVDDFNMWEYF